MEFVQQRFSDALEDCDREVFGTPQLCDMFEGAEVAARRRSRITYFLRGATTAAALCADGTLFLVNAQTLQLMRTVEDITAVSFFTGRYTLVKVTGGSVALLLLPECAPREIFVAQFPAS